MHRPFFLLLLMPASCLAQWPMLHGDAAHRGRVGGSLDFPLAMAWAAEFPGERLGTAMEPVVDAERVFVATHRGGLYALSAADGKGVWRFESEDAFLQSPCIIEGTVVAGGVDGFLYGLDPGSGEKRWALNAGTGGIAASPVAADGVAFVGTRSGLFLAAAVKEGRTLWQVNLGVPIRQTAAVWQGRVFVTAEDLRVRCLEASTGKLIWTSRQLEGQSARDYYPMIVETADGARVVVRTSPTLGMAQRIGRDRGMLCRNVGVDDRGWEKVEAWIKSDASRGNPALWHREQEAIIPYLEANPDARTFFVLDAGTGKETQTAPVLWVSGCQGVGAMPAQTGDGRLLVFYRSAYGSWSHGVAPLVALGLLDLDSNRITPLDHGQGRKTPWNTFWGTADESQNFSIAGDTVLISHQGTLSGFDLKADRLFPIWGNRDTYGGWRNPPWARNEWHGPGRGAAAVFGGDVYWITGSRVLALRHGDRIPVEPHSPVADLPVVKGTVRPATPDAVLRQQLNEAVAELLSRDWAPLWIEPGLSGREFDFDHSGNVLEAMAWCWPHLDEALRPRTKALLDRLWREHPPVSAQAWFDLDQGMPREPFLVPPGYRLRAGSDRPHHPFGNTHAVWWYAERCDAWEPVLEQWPEIRAAFESFADSGWRLDGARGDLYANRYLASLQALGRIADRAGDAAASDRAGQMAGSTTAGLVAWWKRVAEQGTMMSFKDTSQLDPFIGKGDGLSFRVAAHRHKVALLRDLTPGVAAQLREQAPDEVSQVLSIFESIYQTWHVVGEERQVHFGENFVDPPDLAMGGFQALAWLRQAPAGALSRKVDLPFCRADLDYLMKLAICLDAAAFQ